MKTVRQGDNEKGRLNDTPAHLIDIMATCVDVGGAKYPQEFKGNAITPMEGTSLKPLLVSSSPSLPISRSLFWEHEGNAAVRVGDMKLVRKGRNAAWELYDMKTDRTELHDLATEQPEKAKELAALWEAWAERAHVKPFPNEGGAKKKGKGKKKAAAPK
jgi:arylsulfatase A-like enzyme